MIRDSHERRIAAPPDDVGALLETLGSPGDRLWRTRIPERMVLDRGLEPGSRGGHGPVRYRVSAHVPGRSVEFTFERPFPLVGTHRFEVEPTAGGGALLRHTLEGRATGALRWQWPLFVKAAHVTVVEDIHDHAERTLTGTAHRTRPASRRVRALLALLALLPERRPRRATSRREPEVTGLLTGSLARVDAGDTWTTPLLDGDADDVRSWQDGVFSAAPAWVRRLMALRDRLVGPLGLRTAGGHRGGFPELAASGDEVLTGLDDRHLSFRVSTRLSGGEVAVTTLVQVHNGLGRLYWSVVRWFHPVVVRSLLRRVPAPLAQAGASTSTGR